MFTIIAKSGKIVAWEMYNQALKIEIITGQVKDQVILLPRINFISSGKKLVI